MKATEQHFPVVLFKMPYKVVLTFESVERDYSNERCCAVCSIVNYAVQVLPNIPSVVITLKAFPQYSTTKRDT